MFFVINESIKIVQRILEKEADAVRDFCYDTCHDDSAITLLIKADKHEQALQFLDRHSNTAIVCEKLLIGV